MGVGIEVITPGDGKKPKKGQTIVCHYVGMLENGNIFDSSRHKGKPLRFTLGTGYVIKGWDQGFRQLSRGAVAKLTCPPDYGFGVRGAPGVVPPNSTLTFEVEILDII